MARGTQHRKRRPAANARVAQPTAKAAKAAKRQKQHPSWEDQLFFSRLRVHAKWVFVFLALVFAVGFVIFGVGSGSTGISDVLQNFFNGTSSTGSSLSALQKKTIANPKDAKAWRDLATRLEQDNKDDEAITALTTYTTLKPSNQDALRELAGIYLRRAQAYNTLYTEAQARNQALAPASVFQPKSGSKLAQALTSLPSQFSTAVTSQTSTATSNLYSKLLGYLSQRLDTYKKLAALSPKDATTQFELAQAAQDSGDAQTAVTALKRFLKLAPGDSLAPTAKKILKQLEASLKPAASGTAKIAGK